MENRKISIINVSLRASMFVQWFVEGRRLNVVILRWSLRYDVTSSTRIFKPHVLIFVPKSARTLRQRGAPDHTEYCVWQLDAALAACSTCQRAWIAPGWPVTRPRDLPENSAKGHFHIQRSFRGSMCGAPVLVRRSSSRTSSKSLNIYCHPRVHVQSRPARPPERSSQVTHKGS